MCGASFKNGMEATTGPECGSQVNFRSGARKFDHVSEILADMN